LTGKYAQADSHHGPSACTGRDGEALLEHFHFVDHNLNAILYKYRMRNPYDSSVFVELCWLSKTLADLTRLTEPVA
jgi:hypothetical protein